MIQTLPKQFIANGVQTVEERSDLALFDQLPVILQVLDREGRLLTVNARWLRVLGYERSQVVGRRFSEFLTETGAERFSGQYLPALLDQGTLEEVECPLVHQDGTVVEMMLSASAETDETGEVTRLLVAMRDISRRKQAEQTLYELAKATANVTGDTFFRTLVDRLAKVFGARSVFVTECANQAMTRVRTLARMRDNQIVENIEFDLAGTPCEGVIGGAVCHYPRNLEQLFPCEIGNEGYLGVPFYDSQGRILGHIAVIDDKPLHCDPRDIAVLEIFAARSGAELECKQKSRALRHHQEELTHLYAQLQDTNRYLEQQVADRTQEIERRRLVAESLRDMVLILNSNHPLSEILDYIVATATQLLGADSGAIYSLEQDQQILVIQAARGLPAAYAHNLSFAVERSFLGQAILRRQPIVFSNLAEALAERDIDLDSSRRAMLADHYQTLLAIPLLRQTVEGEIGEVFGGIALYYPEPRPFSDEEIRLSVAFGAQAALAIENARLRQQVEQMAVQEERSRLSRELHDSVTQSLYSLTLLAEGWRRLAKNGRLEQVDEALTELGQISQQALREMRLLVYALRPQSLEEAGLVGALHQRLNAVEKRSGVDARLMVTGVLALPAPVENCLYRIAQEALNNCLKHAVATAVTVRVVATTADVTLEIIDNGRGFAPELAHESPGIGLSSMRERAEKLGGAITVISEPGQGTTVRVQMPLLSGVQPALHTLLVHDGDMNGKV